MAQIFAQKTRWGGKTGREGEAGREGQREGRLGGADRREEGRQVQVMGLDGTWACWTDAFTTGTSAGASGAIHCLRSKAAST